MTANPEAFDVIVIGAGQAGSPLAGACAAAGRRTALVERRAVGGTCVNDGCTPTKTLIASARAAALARRSSDYGVRVGDVRVAWDDVLARKRTIVDEFRSGSENRLRSTPNLTLIDGEARFTAAHAVEVRGKAGPVRQITAPAVVINTGGRPARPDLPGIETVDVLDSTSIMELPAVPEHLVVLGGSYIGLEFGQMFRRFGARVTVVHRGPQLFNQEDPDIAGAVADILRDDGVDILLGADAVSLANVPGGVRLTVRVGDQSREVLGTRVLAAIGRVPNTDRLNLAAAGVDTDRRGFIRVNDRLETSVPGIYAAGDVNGGPAFTHVSYDDYRILRDNLLHAGQSSTKARLVPYTVFIDPQLGRVGLTETQARAEGRTVRVASMPMSWVARALETAEPRGLVKAVVDAATGQLLGCAVLGLEGGEIMSMLQIAMMGKLPYHALQNAVFAHPTLAEGLNTLFGTLSP